MIASKIQLIWSLLGNIQVDCWKFLGQLKHHSGSQIPSESFKPGHITEEDNPKICNQTWVLHVFSGRVCSFQFHSFDLDEFPINRACFPACASTDGKTIDRVLRTQTHFCCKWVILMIFVTKLKWRLKCPRKFRPSPWTDSILPRRHLDTHSLLSLIIMLNKNWFLGDLNQVFFNRTLASTVGCERQDPYVMGCNSYASEHSRASCSVFSTLRNTLRLV